MSDDRTNEDQNEDANGSEFSTRLRWGAATDAGRVRSANEDSWLVDFPLFAVADGMGGHAAGEVASRVALDTLRTSVTDHSLESLVAAVKVANSRVFEMSRTDNSMRGMGTTLSAVALVMIESHERLAVVNVGDSRVYVLQDGTLIQVSEDHSLVESMVRQGTLTHEQAKVHPQRNILTPRARHRWRRRRRLVGGRTVLRRPLPALQRRPLQRGLRRKHRPRAARHRRPR